MRAFFAKVALIVAVAVLVVGCDSLLGRQTIYKDATGLRTFPVADLALCNLSRLLDPVSGTLHIEQGASDQAWIEADDGTHLSVVWPQGFTVRFDPDAALLDETGRLLKRDGDHVELSQVPPTAATGTYGDPYFATGGVFEGCYPRRFTNPVG